MNIKIEVEKILMKEKNLDTPPDINANLQDDLGFDSVDHLELAFALEDFFEVEITEDDLAQVKTVKDVVQGITDKIFKPGGKCDEINDQQAVIGSVTGDGGLRAGNGEGD